VSQFDKFKAILDERLLDEAELSELRALSDEYSRANPMPKEAMGDLKPYLAANELMAFWCDTTSGMKPGDVAGMERVRNVSSACAKSVVRLFNPKFDQ
jgi:hypothetical protein